MSVYVRPAYVQSCRDGLVMYPLREGRVPACADTLRPSAVLTSPQDIAQSTWDQLWLCVSSTALEGDWLGAVLAAAPDATVVTLQPGLKDRDLLLQYVPENKLVTGLITFISWQAPLPGEHMDAPPGIMYWLPPLTGSPFSGPRSTVKEITDTLKKGGMRASRQDNLPAQMAIAAAAMSPAMAGLESAGWSFQQFRRGDAIRLAVAAARQSMVVAAAYHKQPPPMQRLLMQVWLLKWVVLLAPRLMPFDLQRYLQYHFTKVGDQTRAALRITVVQGQQHNLPTDSVAELLASVTQMPQGRAPSPTDQNVEHQ